ncbi:MAG: hypothetical protein R2862_03915 [Thermoanaerobaculia bacterium]
MRDSTGPSSIDRWTLVAVAILAYAVANVSHEGIGHGGVCVAVGGVPRTLNAIYFDCDRTGLDTAAGHWISAAGTLVNFLLAGVAGLALHLGSFRSARWRYFLTLTWMVNLLQATGYWLFSGVGGIGDWNAIVAELPGYGFWRAGLALAGLTGYWLVIRASLRRLEPFLGDGDDRLGRARTLTLVPYLTGGALSIAAGALNPESPMLVLISAAAASLGGTSAFAWMYTLLRDRQRFPPLGGVPEGVPRSMAWIAAAAVAALVFVAVLGPGVQLSTPP